MKGFCMGIALTQIPFRFINIQVILSLEALLADQRIKIHGKTMYKN